MITWLLVITLTTPGVAPESGTVAIFATPELCELAGFTIATQLMVETGGMEGIWSHRCIPQQGAA